MNVTPFPSGVTFSPISDFDGKLVETLAPTRVLSGIVLMNLPTLVIWSMKIGEVTPNDASGVSLLKTFGKVPSAVDAALFGRKPGNGTVPPATVDAG